MIALAAFLLTSKVRFATVAGAVNTLADLLADQILTASLAGDGDAVGDVALALLVTNFGVVLLKGFLLLVLCLLGRETRALLAPLVVAFATLLVGSEGGLAFVAGAVNTHADLLVFALTGRVVANGPVLGAELETVLLEQSLGSLGSRDGARRWSRRLLRLRLSPGSRVSNRSVNSIPQFNILLGS